MAFTVLIATIVVFVVIISNMLNRSEIMGNILIFVMIVFMIVNTLLYFYMLYGAEYLLDSNQIGLSVVSVSDPNNFWKIGAYLMIIGGIVLLLLITIVVVLLKEYLKKILNQNRT